MEFFNSLLETAGGAFGALQSSEAAQAQADAAKANAAAAQANANAGAWKKYLPWAIGAAAVILGGVLLVSMSKK